MVLELIQTLGSPSQMDGGDGRDQGLGGFKSGTLDVKGRSRGGGFFGYGPVGKSVSLGPSECPLVTGIFEFQPSDVKPKWRARMGRI